MILFPHQPRWSCDSSLQFLRPFVQLHNIIRLVQQLPDPHQSCPPTEQLLHSQLVWSLKIKVIPCFPNCPQHSSWANIQRITMFPLNHNLPIDSKLEILAESVNSPIMPHKDWATQQSKNKWVTYSISLQNRHVLSSIFLLFPDCL
jgi:hypothetical protein